MKKINLAAKWAVIYTVLSLAWFQFENLMHWHDTHIKWHALYTNIFILISIAVYVFYFKKVASLQMPNYWRSLFLSGIILTLFATILAPITLYIGLTYISPNFFVNVQNHVVAEKMMTMVQAQDYFNFKSYLWQTLSGSLSFGVVLSGIMSYFFKSKNIKAALLVPILLGLNACGGLQSTIRNIDENAVKPRVENNKYIITEKSTDKKYGVNPDFPINIGYVHPNNEEVEIAYFMNAISGPNDQAISYKKVAGCCPFPTKNDLIGGGLLAVYEVRWEGQSKPVKLYFNTYEKGKIIVPAMFQIKK